MTRSCSRSDHTFDQRQQRRLCLKAITLQQPLEFRQQFLQIYNIRICSSIDRRRKAQRGSDLRIVIMFNNERFNKGFDDESKWRFGEVRGDRSSDGDTDAADRGVGVAGGRAREAMDDLEPRCKQKKHDWLTAPKTLRRRNRCWIPT
ncbi:hypothetical protein LOK49_LG02G01855 [Camellia lanceoleosa]|uniref:Uncharacterized protein n=1 Tax=Camellia lanceoleosa TaxID=1840588 RepID=A0ACC0IMP1_9ERIC|nr:hypothetical protein LOK49_LG02G01855 [Camellia lanceoleosa]